MFKEKYRNNSYNAHFIVRTDAGGYVLRVFFRKSDTYNVFIIAYTESKTEIVC